jgi:hypothetical protein
VGGRATRRPKIPVIMKDCRAFRSHHDPEVMIARIKGGRLFVTAIMDFDAQFDR